MKFLVVDDSLTMRRIISKTLGQLGYDQVTQAENGKEALARMDEAKPDLVITDWNMPVMNGLELIRAIRASEAHKNIPILMVTTNSAKGDVIEALKAGANNFVGKPMTAETLKEKIQATVSP